MSGSFCWQMLAGFQKGRFLFGFHVKPHAPNHTPNRFTSLTKPLHHALRSTRSAHSSAPMIRAVMGTRITWASRKREESAVESGDFPVGRTARQVFLF